MRPEVDAVLEPYFARIRERRGLRRWLNQALRTRPHLVDLLRVITRFLVHMEALFDYTGAVRLTRNRLYAMLAEAEPEWVLLAPHPLPGPACLKAGGRIQVPLVVENRLELDQATALGRHVGLLQQGPRGIWGLSAEVLKQLRAVSAGAAKNPPGPEAGG